MSANSSLKAGISGCWVHQISRKIGGGFELELWDKQGIHWRTWRRLATWYEADVLLQRVLTWNADGKLRWFNAEFELVGC